MCLGVTIFITIIACYCGHQAVHRYHCGGSRGCKPLWRPLEWRPFAINAPLFGANGSRNSFKNTLN